MRALSMATWVVLCLALLASTPSSAESLQTLTFHQRVAAQEAIERVYYAHQIGTTKPFEEAVRREVLEAKVRRYLLQSAALEKFWNTPVNAKSLRRELDRIARNTRFPGRLEMIYTALRNDPFLVQECFVRPVLVDRLTRNFFAHDERIHAAAAKEADRLRDRLALGHIDPEAAAMGRTVIEFQRDKGQIPRPRRPSEPERVFLSPEEFDAWRSRAPWTEGVPEAVRQEHGGFRVSVRLSAAADLLRIATYDVPKRSRESWLEEMQEELDLWSVAAIASTDAPLPPPTTGPEAGLASGMEGATPCLPDDTWNNDNLENLISGRRGHTAVWTGSEMIVWGGHVTNSGGRYDPVTDHWTATSMDNAPSARGNHASVWTGDRMIVWGGEADDGGLYDPVSDSWTPMDTSQAPPSRNSQAAAWTGDRMIIWGGTYVDGGGVYDPETDSWSPISLVDAPSPRSSHAAVWTGEELVFWGGSLGTAGHTNSGARYRPETDTWTPMSTSGAPSPRQKHTAVWTGDRVLFWGGHDDDYELDTGGSYDPGTDTWTPLSTSAAPEGRHRHTAIWTGDRMLVWGGDGPSGYLNTGASYDPVTDSWTATTNTNAPPVVHSHTAVWTGSRMIVWGGLDRNSGGRYDPVKDWWTPTATPNVPWPRSGHGSVWTGNLMLIWGGGIRAAARYDPVADSWTDLATMPAQIELGYAALPVWTGQEMLFWSGESGGRYDPASDSWTVMTTVGSPPASLYHATVWSGKEMIVWGGSPNLNTGGRYDPETDTWHTTSTEGAPPGRSSHRVAWTGQEMIVWGGFDDITDRVVATGGRYDPETDTWAPMLGPGPPSVPAWGYTLLWTGREMIVWGGYSFTTGYLGTGGRYNPDTHIWAPTSMVGAPSPRLGHSAVWTGAEMIIWAGGRLFDRSDTGGRYLPSTDTWLPISAVGAPSPRRSHSAVWTGQEMIVWGGEDYGNGRYFLLSSGGRYTVGHDADVDGDGISLCAGDCDDLDPDIYPGAPELCDGLDNNCDGVVPPDEVDGDEDGALACTDCDDNNPSRFPGNIETCDDVDNDCDGISDNHPTICGLGACMSKGVCSSGIDTCVPGPPSAEVCDGVDNDCDGVLPEDEIDRDADGVRACSGDCQDLYPFTYPGAVEVHDLEDNQCPGEVGFGIVDEISGITGFLDPEDRNLFSWAPQMGAVSYEVVRSESPQFADCTRRRASNAYWVDPDVPAAGTVWYYLVQSTVASQGSYGVDSSGTERPALCGIERDCADHLDGDGDGSSDCRDPDCYGKSACTINRFYKIDSFGDDMGTQELEEWFRQLALRPADHLTFHVGGGGLPIFESCTERADFYADEYLALASTGGEAISGGWQKWHRLDSQEWIGPITDGFPNWFGEYCAEPYSWCHEVGLGGHVLGIAPWETGVCEAFDNISCGDGNTVLWIAVGIDRQSACGF